jgi:hypothetical protein
MAQFDDLETIGTGRENAHAMLMMLGSLKVMCDEEKLVPADTNELKAYISKASEGLVGIRNWFQERQIKVLQARGETTPLRVFGSGSLRLVVNNTSRGRR